MKMKFKHLVSPLLVAAAVALTGCNSAPMKTTGQYIDDSVLTSRVKAAIFNEPALKSTEISVETYQGKVQLSGFVKDAKSIPAATNVASKVEGVKSVKNSLTVK